MICKPPRLITSLLRARGIRDNGGGSGNKIRCLALLRLLLVLLLLLLLLRGLCTLCSTKQLLQGT